MSTNQQIVQKADIALSDIAAAGKLSPQQTDRFLRTLIEQPTVLSVARTVAMTGPQMKLNKIGFGSRVLRPAVSGVALSSSDRVKPDIGFVQLDTHEVIATVYIPYDVLEDNIEGGNIATSLQGSPGGLHQTIVDLLAERAASDLEEWALNGDTTSGDPYLAQSNGYLKLSNANVVAVNGPFDKAAAKAALKTMPVRYLRNRAGMMHMVSVDNETEARDQYGSRQTAMGDAQVQGILPIYLFGSRIAPVPLMRGDQGLYTDPLNLIFGIQRNIQIEYDKDIEARIFKIVLTCRVAFQIEEVNAVVKYTNITGSR